MKYIDPLIDLNFNLKYLPIYSYYCLIIVLFIQIVIKLNNNCLFI